MSSDDVLRQLNVVRPHFDWDRLMPLMPPKNPQLADTFVGELKEWISGLEKELEPNKQLRLTVILANGKEVVVEWFGYHNPNLVAIKGTYIPNGHSCTVLVHQESVQVLCEIEDKEPSKPQRQIGFQKLEPSPSEE